MSKAFRTSDSTRVEVSTFKNKEGKFVNIRKFYKTQKSEDWLPTRQGITIPEEKVAKFLKAIKFEFEDIENAEELPNEKEGSSKSRVSKKTSSSKDSKKKREDD